MPCSTTDKKGSCHIASDSRVEIDHLMPVVPCTSMLHTTSRSELHQNGRRAVHASDRLIGRPAPQCEHKSLHGEDVSLANYRGKVVLLNFWAACMAEFSVFL
jgi:hypothetical protein